ncbi:uncharacterized protein CTRU02_206160 [Colletotrichum truncatum]|uniref:Uncharacterized protein n=1 Tax=Colletotrichum truncatum TaxID=5467 RepID=A0ACC3Z669_COLTU|nr:uncharacterized protein CTRU02_10422 [Colletotrichum truncatum]KAF6787159.1 hypothetical protein CTRU02_10422 [Colletotrichum truncatum]
MSLVFAPEEMEHTAYTSVNMRPDALTVGQTSNSDANARIKDFFKDPPYVIAAGDFPGDLTRKKAQRVDAVVEVIGLVAATGVFEAATPDQLADGRIPLANVQTEGLLEIGAQFDNA